MSSKSRKDKQEGSASDYTPPAQPGSQPAESRKLLQILSSQRQVFESFVGPLPPPQILHQYNEIVPGLASRIAAQAERQTEHRISLESKVIRSDISRSWAGLICGFVLCLICIIGGVVCVLQGHDWAGTVISTGAVVGLATAFIYGTNLRKAERLEKSKILAGKSD